MGRYSIIFMAARIGFLVMLYLETKQTRYLPLLQLNRNIILVQFKITET